MVSKNGFSSIKSKYPSLFSPQGNVHMSFYPIDTWSALFIIDDVISNTCNSKTNNVKAKAAASATKVFIDEAQQNFTKVGLRSSGNPYGESDDMYNKFFGQINDKGYLVLGNSAINPANGQPYPAHLEFGYNAHGTRVGPYNYIRPAVYKAAEKYRQELSRDTMLEVQKMIALRSVYANVLSAIPPNKSKTVRVGDFETYDSDLGPGSTYTTPTYGSQYSMPTTYPKSF